MSWWGGSTAESEASSSPSATAVEAIQEESTGIVTARLKRLLKQRGVDEQALSECTGLEELKSLGLRAGAVHVSELSQLEARTLQRKDSDENLSNTASLQRKDSDENLSSTASLPWPLPERKQISQPVVEEALMKRTR